MALNPLNFLGDMFGKVADKVAPDKGKILEAQSRLNEQELTGAPVSRLRLWRSALGWIVGSVFGFCIVFEVLIRPLVTFYSPETPLPPPFDLTVVTRVLLGMLGLGV